MVSCPVNAPDDFSAMNKEGQANLPRAIIQLINKKEEKPMTTTSSDDGNRPAAPTISEDIE